MFFGSRKSKIYKINAVEPLRDLENEGHGQQAEIHTVAFKVNDLEIQGHVIEIKNSIYHFWIP